MAEQMDISNDSKGNQDEDKAEDKAETKLNKKGRPTGTKKLIGKHVHPETLVRAQVTKELWDLSNQLKVIAYPISVMDFANRRLCDLTLLSEACQFKFLPGYFDRSPYGVLELIMRTPAEAESIVQELKALNPELSAAIQGDTPYSEICEKSQLCEVGSPADRTLCVYGVPPEATEEQVLTKYPGQNVLLKRDKDGKCTGLGFITFLSKEKLEELYRPIQDFFDKYAKEGFKTLGVYDVAEKMDGHRLSVFPLSQIPVTPVKPLADNEITRNVQKAINLRIGLCQLWDKYPVQQLISKFLQPLEEVEIMLGDDNRRRALIEPQKGPPKWYMQMQKTMFVTSGVDMVTKEHHVKLMLGCQKLRSLLEARLEGSDKEDAAKTSKGEKEDAESRKLSSQKGGYERSTSVGSVRKEPLLPQPGSKRPRFGPGSEGRNLGGYSDSRMGPPAPMGRPDSMGRWGGPGGIGGDMRGSMPNRGMSSGWDNRGMSSNMGPSVGAMGGMSNMGGNAEDINNVIKSIMSSIGGNMGGARGDMGGSGSNMSGNIGMGSMGSMGCNMGRGSTGAMDMVGSSGGRPNMGGNRGMGNMGGMGNNMSRSGGEVDGNRGMGNMGTMGNSMGSSGSNIGGNRHMGNMGGMGSNMGGMQGNMGRNMGGMGGTRSSGNVEGMGPAGNMGQPGSPHLVQNLESLLQFLKSGGV